MAVAEGLAAKVGLSLGAAGVGATGIYFGNNYLNDYVYISKYERALIEFLNDHEENDIVFEVKKGEDAGTDLVDGDITFSSASGSTSPIKVKVKVAVDSTSPSAFLKTGSTPGNNDASDINKIKQLGDEGNWTWECSFNFILEGNLPTGAQIQNKDRIFKNPDQGLFGILKKGIANYNGNGAGGSWTRGELKRVKADFIRQCGNQRLVSKNRELSKEEKKATDAEMKIEDINIKFLSSNNTLVPKEGKDKATFNYWFKDEFKDRQYSTGS